MDFETIVFLIIGLAFMVSWWMAWARIFRKTGHHSSCAFLMFIPIMNLITIFWLAFSRWPVEDGIDWNYKKIGKML